MSDVIERAHGVAAAGILTLAASPADDTTTIPGTEVSVSPRVSRAKNYVPLGALVEIGSEGLTTARLWSDGPLPSTYWAMTSDGRRVVVKALGAGWIVVDYSEATARALQGLYDDGSAAHARECAERQSWMPALTQREIAEIASGKRYMGLCHCLTERA